VSGTLHRRPQLGLVLEKVRQPAKEYFHELLRGHRRAIRMPEAGYHHVLYRAGFAVSEPHLYPLVGAVAAQVLVSDRAAGQVPLVLSLARAFPAGSPSHSGSLK